jgi:hypothetical protein
LPEGPRRRPKGIPLLTLMASLLDPRTKGGVGIPAADQEFLFGKITEAIIMMVDEPQPERPMPEPANNTCVLCFRN